MDEKKFLNEVRTIAADLQRLATVGQTHAREIAVRMFRRMDATVHPLEFGVACRRGCSYCCNYHVYVTATEAFALAELVEKLEPSDKSQIEKQLEENFCVVSNMTVAQHIHTNVRCAFLSNVGECMAYEVRPSACRGHHATDVNTCKVTFEDTRSTLQNVMKADLKMTSTAFVLAQEMAHIEAGFDDKRYELTAAVREAKANPASFKRYKAGKKAFPSVRDVTEPNARNSDHGLG
jgi:Fe-S-cluster containining protein